MKKLLLILLVLCSFQIFGQDEKPQPDRWRGLIIDQSTAEDAIKLFGNPKKDDATSAFTPVAAGHWFGRFGKSDKKFRKLFYKDVSGVDSVTLLFLNDKLAVIQLDMKKDLSAVSLTSAYGIKFFPLVGNYASGLTIADITNQSREILMPTDGFPPQYQMAGASEKTIVLAYASTGTMEYFANTLGKAPGKPTKIQSASLPGLVRVIQIASRKLEDTKGADVLK